MLAGPTFNSYEEPNLWTRHFLKFDHLREIEVTKEVGLGWGGSVTIVLFYYASIIGVPKQGEEGPARVR